MHDPYTKETGRIAKAFDRERRKRLRNMKLELECKRPGAPAEGFKIEWREPEGKALETYAHFHQCLVAMLKAHGLMQG